jgi:hypothetical protein
MTNSHGICRLDPDDPDDPDDHVILSIQVCGSKHHGALRWIAVAVARRFTTR